MSTCSFCGGPVDRATVRSRGWVTRIGSEPSAPTWWRLPGYASSAKNPLPSRVPRVVARSMWLDTLGRTLGGMRKVGRDARGALRGKSKTFGSGLLQDSVGSLAGGLGALGALPWNAMGTGAGSSMLEGADGAVAGGPEGASAKAPTAGAI